MRRLLEEAGVSVIRTPARAPNCNAHAERFVRSIKEECLDRIVTLGERHLRRMLAEFTAHYHGEGNHQGLGNDLIDCPEPQRPAVPSGPGSALAVFSPTIIGQPRSALPANRVLGHCGSPTSTEGVGGASDAAPRPGVGAPRLQVQGRARSDDEPR